MTSKAPWTVVYSMALDVIEVKQSHEVTPEYTHSLTRDDRGFQIRTIALEAMPCLTHALDRANELHRQQALKKAAQKRAWSRPNGDSGDSVESSQ
jgi:hypothetical protein